MVFNFRFVSLPLFLSLREYVSIADVYGLVPVVPGSFSRKGLTIKDEIVCSLETRTVTIKQDN